MPFTNSPLDDARLHYVDYRPASQPTPFSPGKDYSSTGVSLVFIHGWPMSLQMWSHLMLPLCESHRLRCVATDRRGFGKSEWSGNGKVVDITYDTFAADTVHVLQELKLGNFVFVASSMGCGETILAYEKLGKDMKAQCLGFLWLGPSLPFPLKTDATPTGPPRELWDAILGGLREDRYGFAKAAIPGIFGVPDGVEVGEDTLNGYESIVAQADVVALERCVQIITTKDFTGELKDLTEKVGSGKEKVGLLVLHGDIDRGMPYEASSGIIKKLVPEAEVHLYKMAAHGLYLTHKKQVMDALLEFVVKRA